MAAEPFLFVDFYGHFSIFPSSKKAQKAILGFLKLKKLESKVKNLTFMHINQSVTTQTDMIRPF
jgi:hypothetical protein